MEQPEVQNASKAELPEVRGVRKAAAALYNDWMKNHELRVRRQEEELKRLERAGDGYGTHKRAMRKYSEMRARHDELERKYRRLDYYNEKFLKEFLTYRDLEKDSDPRCYNSFAGKCASPLVDPNFNVFSPLGEEKPHARSTTDLKTYCGMRLYEDLVKKLRSIKREEKVTAEKQQQAPLEGQSLDFFPSIQSPGKKARQLLLPPIKRIDNMLLEEEKMKHYLCRPTIKRAIQ